MSSSGGPTTLDDRVSPDMRSLLAGVAFAESVAAGIDPPPGYTFANRFLNGPRDLWTDIVDSLPRFSSLGDDAVDTALGELQAALAQLPGSGASVRTVAALEEETTTCLARLCRQLATAVVRRHPHLSQPGERGIWGGPDAGVDAVAEAIRSASNAVVVACASHPLFDHQPKAAIAFVIAHFRAMAELPMKTGTVESLSIGAAAQMQDAIVSSRAFADEYEKQTTPGGTIPPPKRPIPRATRPKRDRSGMWRRLPRLALFLAVVGLIVWIAFTVRSDDDRDDDAATATTQATVTTSAATTPTTAPTEPTTTTAPEPTTTAPREQPPEVDVGAFVAQVLASALADGDWDLARATAPALVEWSDLDLRAAYGPVEQMLVGVADWAVAPDTIELWLTAVTHERNDASRTTTVSCVHWTFLEGWNVIQLHGVQLLRTVDGYEDDAVTAADRQGCSTFDR